MCWRVRAIHLGLLLDRKLIHELKRTINWANLLHGQIMFFLSSINMIISSIFFCLSLLVVCTLVWCFCQVMEFIITVSGITHCDGTFSIIFKKPVLLLSPYLLSLFFFLSLSISISYFFSLSSLLLISILPSLSPSLFSYYIYD